MRNIKEKFPIEDGWLHGKLRIDKVAKLTITKDICLKIFCLGLANPDDYEVGHFKHYKTIVRICFRKKRNTDETSNRR